MSVTARAFLRARGVEEAEIDAAATADDGTLLLLVVEHLLGLRSTKRSMGELADARVIDPYRARRYWRAMGFPDLPDGERTLGEPDVEALRLATQHLADDADLEVSLAQARAISAAMARVAEVWTDPLRQAHGAGVAWDALADHVIAEFDAERVSRLLDYVHRRQVLAIVRRDVGQAARASDGRQAVGFVDLVGYTELSGDLDEVELGRLVALFEATTYDAVAAGAGRFVKLIGDEAMFTHPHLDGAVEIALGIIRYAADAGLPPIRAGLAAGPVLVREGDCYGQTVNLANRLVDVALPHTVALPANTTPITATADSIDLGLLHLKGIGEVHVECLRVSPGGA